MNKIKLKSLLTLFGKLLGVLGLVFVFYTLSQEYTLSSFTQQFILFIDVLPLLMLLNILSILIGIYAWQKMLQHYATSPLDYITAYYHFSKTEIAKYLPGNIFHFLGRQMLSSKIGISQAQMLKISLLFSLLLLTGTILTSSIFAFLSLEVANSILILMALATLISMGILFYLYPTFPLKKKLSLNLSLAFSIALQGLMLGFIVMVQNENLTLSLFFLCVSIYTLSWLIGFATPGASGGLGVREGTFIAMVSYLSLDISNESIVFSILLVRLINILVDVLLYLSTFIIKNKIKEIKV
jgi:hypothetical protein